MAQARTEFAAALNQIASEKGVEVEVVLAAIEQAALAAYRKDLSLRGEEIPEDFDSLTSKIDRVTGEIKIFRGDKDITPPGFARIAAQTAKQVIMQRLYEAEKGAIMDEFGAKVGTIISGSIQRQDGSSYYVDLGRAEGVMPMIEQTRGELYHQGQRLKFLIKQIQEGSRGPEVILSRSDADLVKGLFAAEVPEIQSGSVEIKAIAREAGGRTKVAAISSQAGVDPVGSLVGQKGVRVQAVMNELGEEKIDIISYSEDPARFIAAALSPAKDVVVELNEKEKVATVKIPTSQLSLAIGKGGQNVRLAAKLTGWKIDIVGAEEPEGTAEQKEQPQAGTQTTQIAPEASDKEAEETEATDPKKTQAEAVVEAAEENITEAQQKESKGGELEEEPVVDDPKAAADAEKDMEKEAKNGDK